MTRVQPPKREPDVRDMVALRVTPDRRTAFRDLGYVALPGFLTPYGLGVLREESARLEPLAQRRDFAMASMGGTPRRMETLGGHEIVRVSRVIPAMYEARPVRRALSTLVGQPVVTADDAIERFVFNVLNRVGDTHGAHVDDYPIALVMVLDAPTSSADGGLLELIEVPKRPAVHHRPGDAYVLRSDYIQHRVTPLNVPGKRVVLNFAYGFSGQSPVRRTESAAILYGGMAAGS